MVHRVVRYACWLAGALELGCNSQFLPAAHPEGSAPADEAEVSAADERSNPPFEPAPSAEAEQAHPSPTETQTPATDATEAAPHTFALALDDLPAALIVVPAELNAPLVVAAHGAGGSPEWQCEWLQAIARSRPLLLACLRGKPMLPYEGAFYYPEHHTLGKMFTQTLSGLKPTLAQRRATLQLYVGYSQGATMGALMLHEVESVPPNLLLVEGGYEGWTDKRCRAFQTRGGRRVYFACGTNSCAKQAKLIVERLRNAGVDAQYGWAQGAGHTPGGAVGALAATGLDWLLGKPRIP